MITPEQERRITAHLAAHHVLARHQALELGLSPSQVKRLVKTGRWEIVLPGVYVPAGVQVGHDTLLAAACLRAGPTAVASHRSAAWLWGLLDRAPSEPSLTITGRPPTWRDRVEVHISRDLDYRRVLIRRGFPATDPMRTLADLGAIVTARQLDDAIDRALAARMLTVEGLEAEVARLGRQGRRGTLQLQRALTARGFAGAPAPSVLESRVHRLLRSWGIVPLGTEVRVCGSRYRVDVLLRPGIVLEVDGYAYHWSPESKAADSHRRNALRRHGLVVIEADWVTVMRHPALLKAEVLETLAKANPLEADPSRSVR